MTIAARKKTHTRQRAAPPGEVRRGPDGEFSMIELLSYRPSPLAPTIFVNKIGGVYRQSANIIRCTFALSIVGISGSIDSVEKVNLLWEQSDWQEAGEQFRWIYQEVNRGTFHRPSFVGDGGGRGRRTQ